jgi:ssRNA-specific RNase YbeY (16S rRNA maturation enzyme)
MRVLSWNETAALVCHSFRNLSGYLHPTYGQARMMFEERYRRIGMSIWLKSYCGQYEKNNAGSQAQKDE